MTSIADVWATVHADVSGIGAEIEQGTIKPAERAGRTMSKRLADSFQNNRTVWNAAASAAGAIVGTGMVRGAMALANNADGIGRFANSLDDANSGLAALGVGAGALGVAAAAAQGLAGASDVLMVATDALRVSKGLFIATTNAETGAVTASGIARARDTLAMVAHTAAEKAAAAASKVFTVGQWLLNAALTANPIGLVIVGIAALVAGFVLAYKKSETFRTIINKAWDVLKKFIGFTPLGALIKNFDALKDAAKSAINFIIRGWNKLQFKIPGFDPPGPGPKFGGVTLGVPKIKELAQGGLMHRGLNLVGERGPELIASAHGGQRVYSNTELLRFAARRSRLDFNDKARLDSGQIADNRLMSKMMLTPLSPYGQVKQGYAPTGMKSYIKPGITINGGIHVTAHKTEGGGHAVSRELRNLAHRFGL